MYVCACVCACVFVCTHPQTTHPDPPPVPTPRRTDDLESQLQQQVPRTHSMHMHVCVHMHAHMPRGAHAMDPTHARHGPHGRHVEQAARTMRDRNALFSSLEQQGVSVNAIASRLGATTSHAVVRAFKSHDNEPRQPSGKSGASPAASRAPRSSDQLRSSTTSAGAARSSSGVFGRGKGAADPHEA